MDYLVLSPELASIEELASQYASSLPPAIRSFVRGAGVTKRGGSNVWSYLLFETDYTQALMALGYRETRAREVELREFLRPADAPPSNVYNLRRDSQRN